MLTIARLFGKSPFAPLQTHMNKVASCIEKLTYLFSLLPQENKENMEKVVAELCKLEHEADITKNDIRNHLPKSLFLPIDRGHFLDILSIQDAIADKTEDIGVLLTLRPLEPFQDLEKEIQLFFKKSVDVFWAACQVIREIDELLESAFGGIEAEKVKAMVEETARKQAEVTHLYRALMRRLFAKGEELNHTSFYLWLKLMEEVGQIAAQSERLANRIRMILELK